tara:strand:- start:597 stop:1418 length:822 start_codon:yes stop_codon:yes gene_type:complete
MNSPKIKRSHVYAKNIFSAKKINNSKFTYLNLKTKNTGDFKNDERYGIYLMFFKKYLIYIGRYCGKKSVKDRWEKHLKTDTSRFRPINFLKCNKIERDKLKNNNINLRKYYNNKKQQLIDKYNISHFKNSSIYFDIIREITEIDFTKEERYFKTLCYDGSDQSLNRLKLADFFWNDLKNRNQNNIFEDFEFVYLKFDKFEKFIPKNNEIKKVKKKFEEFFEKPLIKKFKPGANNDKDKETSKFILKKYDINSLSKDVEARMINLYNKQSFFKE